MAKGKIPTLPKWRKIDDFSYESRDPEGGGIWCFIGSKEASEKVLNERVKFALTFGKIKSPKKGQTHFLKPMSEH